ncbi:MAG TPA: VWA domain-containing protein [Bryobacteraceae bacterium]|jgi:VWFA-related protein|nr:VWA domain-containing protein [Bryobacteraceae bacterium]
MKTSAAVIALALGLGFIALNAQDNPQQGSATVARPRPKPGAKPADQPDSDQAPIPSKLSPKATKDQVAETDATFNADTNLVSVDVAVLDNKGNPIPNLKRSEFRILEDNVPQKLTDFSIGEAPMTVALVVEFSAQFQSFYSFGWAQTLNAAYGFVSTLKPDDYLAIIAYDMRSEILSDFTTDRTKTQEALSRLRVPGFSESNMFDALTDTADRMSKIEGRKAIVLIASGIDTFSKITYDKARKLLQESGVPVYSIEMLQMERNMTGSGGAYGTGNMDFLQGDNELRTFAKETGGQAYFPLFLQDLPQSFQAITQALRNQYTIGYSPNNQARDGKFRRITVQLINPETNEPLKVIENGKTIKYTIVAKNGYTAPRAVE